LLASQRRPWRNIAVARLSSGHEFAKILNHSEAEKMKSEKPGTATLEAEVTNNSRYGFWIFLGDRELFVSFKEFPWFEHAPVSKISSCREAAGGPPVLA
jgi:hypothetical protein